MNNGKAKSKLKNYLSDLQQSFARSFEYCIVTHQLVSCMRSVLCIVLYIEHIHDICSRFLTQPRALLKALDRPASAMASPFVPTPTVDADQQQQPASNEPAAGGRQSANAASELTQAEADLISRRDSEPPEGVFDAVSFSKATMPVKWCQPLATHPRPEAHGARAKAKPRTKTYVDPKGGTHQAEVLDDTPPELSLIHI